MRLIAAATALLLAAPVHALDPATFRLSTGANLLELCSLPTGDPLHSNAMEFCNGYLTGAFQFYDSTTPAADRYVCAPNPPPRPADVMKGYVAWAKASPQHMSDRPVDTLFRFLAETYPCKS